MSNVLSSLCSLPGDYAAPWQSVQGTQNAWLELFLSPVFPINSVTSARGYCVFRSSKTDACSLTMPFENVPNTAQQLERDRGEEPSVHSGAMARGFTERGKRRLLAASASSGGI